MILKTSSPLSHPKCFQFICITFMFLFRSISCYLAFLLLAFCCPSLFIFPEFLCIISAFSISLSPCPSQLLFNQYLDSPVLNSSNQPPQNLSPQVYSALCQTFLFSACLLLISALHRFLQTNLSNCFILKKINNPNLLDLFKSLFSSSNHLQCYYALLMPVLNL